VVDSDPLLCAAADKARIEAANGVAQLDYITHLVTSRGISDIRESHVREFQRIAVRGIYPCGGRYRDANVSIVISGSDHRPPEASKVEHLVVDLVDDLNSSRGREPATRRAAHALWRLNWIHPFRGGNGSSSRALCYLVLCLDMGMMLPGDVTLPSLILDRRDDYLAALRSADASIVDVDGRVPDLTAMESFVTDVVTRQLASVIDRLSGWRGSRSTPRRETDFP
jgi:Fic family protein